MDIQLLGDSHLAYLVVQHPDLLAGLGDRVECLAFGGATADDLAGQAAGRTLSGTAVVSVGTNDLFVGSEVDHFRRTLAAFLGTHPAARWLLVPTPGFDLPEQPGLTDRADAFTVAATKAVLAHGGTVVHTRDVLAPLGPDAFVADGVHLSRAGYEVLVPAIAEACRT